jgi:DNA-binding PadR family transcriptional regulator
MARRPNSSKQTEATLSALLESGVAWRHGYDLARETGLKSGTLYPILMRLEQRGLLEARWEDEPAPGRPRRHLYRLTGSGVQEARASVRSATPVPSRPIVEGAAE